MNFDQLITNATIVDGSGNAPFIGSVGVNGDRIAAVISGPATPQLQARELLDAEGLTLAPGFIDLHSHADFSIQGYPAATTQLAQGVTTALVGNCGSSPFPTDSLENIKRDNAHLDAEFEGTGADAAEFAAATNAVQPGINLALQVGLSSIRAKVVGEAERPASTEEIKLMRAEVARAAEQGVRGFSSGLIYTPGSYSSESEVQALVAEAAQSGLLYSTHMRNETFRLVEAVEEAIAAAEAGGARLEISHLKAMGPENFGKPARALHLIERARERGVDVKADVYPYTASSTRLSSRLPGWAMDGGKDALLGRLSDRDTRQRIASELASRFGRDINPDGVVIAALATANGADGYDWAVGLSLTQIGERDGCTAQEAALRVLAAHDAGVAIVNHAMDPADVAEVLAHPLVSVASDGWTMRPTGEGQPHPRSFGTFVRVLGHYVRDEKVLSLQEAVRKMTSQPAERLALEDRGLIKNGMVADLALFDAAAVRDTSTYNSPWSLAQGVAKVWISGAVAFSDGQVTRARFGKVL